MDGIQDLRKDSDLALARAAFSLVGGGNIE
jgi:hypothetical protein